MIWAKCPHGMFSARWACIPNCLARTFWYWEPTFSKGRRSSANGDITITGNGAAKDAPYVQSLTVNGKTWTQPWLHFSDINHNGKLVYDKLHTGYDWGSQPSNAPPSFDAPAQ